jgi:hypothetical protein
VNKTLKTSLSAAVLGVFIGLSSIASAQAAPAQKHPVATQETKVQHDTRTTSSVADTNGVTTDYMMNRKKPMNMDCKLGFNPTSSSSCNY